jgi:oligopeptide transport system substrate-binding protein
LTLQKARQDNNQAARTLMKLGLTHHNAFHFQRSGEAYDQGFILWQRADRDLKPRRPGRSARTLRLFSDIPGVPDPVHGEGFILSQLYSGLVDITPELDLVPDVAHNWKIESNGQRYIFHLCDDASWSDGTPVTAEDFCFAWRRLLSPATQLGAAKPLYRIRGARDYHQGATTDPSTIAVMALDAHTLAVELEAPTSYFLQLLAYDAMLPLPRHAVNAQGPAFDNWDQVVTNGPFQLESYSEAGPMLLVRNHGYHGRFEGNVQSIELHWPESPDIWLSHEFDQYVHKYQEGALDVLLLWGHPLRRASHLRRFAQEIITIPILQTNAVWFDTSRPPFDDIRVRRAFAMCNDVRVNPYTVAGFQRPATGGLIPPQMPGHSANIGLPFDPVEAGHLLAEGGYPNGRGFPKVAGSIPTGLDIHKRFSAQWSEHLGVDVKWTTPEPDRDGPDPLRPNLWFVGWKADYPDPDTFLRVAFASNQARAAEPWHSEEYAATVERAAATMDQKKRMRFYAEADRALVEAAVVMPNDYLRQHLMVRPSVRRLPTSPMASFGWTSLKDAIVDTA